MVMMIDASRHEKIIDLDWAALLDLSLKRRIGNFTLSFSISEEISQANIIVVGAWGYKPRSFGVISLPAEGVDLTPVPANLTRVRNQVGGYNIPRSERTREIVRIPLDNVNFYIQSGLQENDETVLTGQKLVEDWLDGAQSVLIRASLDGDQFYSYHE
jgi:hypothetical protein